MSVAEVESNASLFNTGGSEPVATALAATLYLLSKHPEVLDKLRRELSGEFKTEEDVNMTSVAGLKYLQAISRREQREQQAWCYLRERASLYGLLQ